jgi:hypothetical protein
VADALDVSDEAACAPFAVQSRDVVAVLAPALVQVGLVSVQDRCLVVALTSSSLEPAQHEFNDRRSSADGAAASRRAYRPCTRHDTSPHLGHLAVGTAE